MKNSEQLTVLQTASHLLLSVMVVERWFGLILQLRNLDLSVIIVNHIMTEVICLIAKNFQDLLQSS